MGRNSGGSNNYAKGSSTPIAVNSNGRKLTQKQVGKMLTTATSTGGMKIVIWKSKSTVPFLAMRK